MTAIHASKVYGQSNPSFAATYNGFVNGDNASRLTGNLTFSTPANAASPVGVYNITPSGLTSSNYAITFADGTLNVTPASLTVTANHAAKVYGQANPNFGASYAGFVNGDNAGGLAGSLIFTSAATAASPVGVYGVTPSGLTSSNYSITFTDGTLDVTPASLTVTAIHASKVYGQANPSFAASYTGFVNGDNASGLSGNLTFSTSANAASPVGVYGITPSGLTSSNYAITFADDTLNVTPASLTVSANPAAKVYGQADPTFSASYNGFVNGDNASGLTGNLTFSTAANATSPVGVYGITPSGLTSSNYAITFVRGILTITPNDFLIPEQAPMLPSQATPTVSTSNAAESSVTADFFKSTPRSLISMDRKPIFSTPRDTSAPDALFKLDASAESGLQTRAGVSINPGVVAPPLVVPVRPGTFLATPGPAPEAIPAVPGTQIVATDRVPAPVAMGTVQMPPGQLRDEIEAQSNSNAVWTVSASGVILSAGYIALSSRLSLWLLSLLTARPIFWRGFDPVEVLFAWEEEKKRRSGGRGTAEEEETLQSMVK